MRVADYRDSFLRMHRAAGRKRRTGQVARRFAAALWWRAMVLRADIAAGLGLRDEARLWYGRFLGLWSKADPEFAPIVARARAAFLAVGGTN